MIGTVQERFETKFVKSDGCWEWIAGKDGKGYGAFWLAGQTQCAHRVSYQLYVGEIPDGFCVCHRCDNPKCIRPNHLFLGTKADNIHDCINKDREAYGEKNGRAKLTEEQVIKIRERYGKGATQVVLAKEFGVGQSTISRIICGNNWIKI